MLPGPVLFLMWTEDPREFIEKMFAQLSGVFLRTPDFITLNPEQKRLDMRRQRGTLDDPLPRWCPVCGKAVALKKHGTKKMYCGNKCRWKAWKERTGG